MTTPQLFKDIRKRPGMYLPDSTYAAAVAFLLGYDAALGGGLLWGFREWLIVKLDDGNNLSWPALVSELMKQDGAGALPKQTERTVPAIEFLFDIVERFLEVRDHESGAKQIYCAYEAWLLKQDWYQAPAEG